MSLAVMTISFVVVGYSLLIIAPFFFSNIIAQKNISADTDKVYYMNLYQYASYLSVGDGNITDFFDKVAEIDGVDGVGEFYLSSVDDSDSDNNELFVISSQLLCMTDLEDTAGKGLTLDRQGDVYPAIVGYKLKDKYPIGSRIKISEGNNVIIYEVTQILEKNSRWLDADIGRANFINLDKKIIINYDDILENTDWLIGNGLNSACFVVNEKYDGEDVADKVIALAKSEGIPLYSTKSLKSLYKKNMRSQLNDSEYIIMPIILIVIAALAMAVSVMIDVYTHKKDITALFISGYSQKSVSCMYVLENVIITITAIAFAAAYWITQENDFYNVEDISYMWLVTIGMIIIGIPVVLITSICPIVKIGKYEPAEIVS